MNILALDIGSGTQDVVYWIEGCNIENCPKFILPSPAVIVSKRIDRASKGGRDIYLYGENMGGGFKKQLRAHIEAGFKVSCSPSAALAISDNLERVRDMGVEIRETVPLGFYPIYLADFYPEFWRNFLSLVGLEYPEVVLVAAQDHGFSPGRSNRKGRFDLWRRFLETGGRLWDLLYLRPPKEMTRLISIHRLTGGFPVADTGGAAVMGALFDPRVEKLSQKQGICIVNVGNSHTVAFLVFRERVYGIYEHHTSVISGDKLWGHLKRFKGGKLSNEEVFEDRGHGCEWICPPPEAGDFCVTFVIGPRRHILESYPVEFISPGSDMMITGALGLIKGYLKQSHKKLKT